MDPTETLTYADPRGFDGDTEAVLTAELDQVEAQLALLLNRGMKDVRWAARNALMTDAQELTALDKIPRDPFDYAEGSFEAGMVMRLRGAVATARKVLEELRAQRAVPLADRDPLSLAATLPAEPQADLPGLPSDGPKGI